MLRSAVPPCFCAAIRSLQNPPALGSKKFRMPTLMSWLSHAPQNHSLFLTIGPPYSADRLEIRLSGLPERKPFCPRSNISFETFCPCIASFSNVPTADPLNTLLPLLVTRLIERPDDCTVTSPPPLVTWISENESKLKYDGDELDERSVIDPPSRFHWTFAVVPRDESVTCWPEVDPPTLRPAWTPGVMLMICHGSRAVGIFSRISAPNVAPVAVFFVSTTGETAEMVISSVIWPISSFWSICALKPV